ncbi:1-phosphofructokinase family hexose kinase [Eubacteriales bacterium OttesenSCG-928-M02]|nr:1-phosphofructokinase family hexose kinase [Eubacteriales bacterium OttesenSCG-928-M02]
MIVSVCLNPSIDREQTVFSFTYGGMNRVLETREDAGGKGVNVALVVRALGADATLVGFAGETGFSLAAEKLAAVGCPVDMITIPGKVRTNLKLLDQSKNIVTEVNEPGPAVSAEHLAAMEELVKRWAKEAGTMVFTGSLPPGCPVDTYARLMAAAKGENNAIHCVVDAEGEKLLAALGQQPSFIKPNDFELGMLLGQDFSTMEARLAGARTLLDKGAQVVLVSMGPEGAMITDGVASYYAPAIPVAVKSTVGAGDAMVAAYCVAQERGLPLKERFVHAVAGGTAAIMTPGTLLVQLADYESLLPQVQVSEIG